MDHLQAEVTAIQQKISQNQSLLSLETDEEMKLLKNIGDGTIHGIGDSADSRNCTFPL